MLNSIFWNLVLSGKVCKIVYPRTLIFLNVIYTQWFFISLRIKNPNKTTVYARYRRKWWLHYLGVFLTVSTPIQGFFFFGGLYSSPVTPSTNNTLKIGALKYCLFNNIWSKFDMLSFLSSHIPFSKHYFHYTKNEVFH